MTRKRSQRAEPGPTRGTAPGDQTPGLTAWLGEVPDLSDLASYLPDFPDLSDMFDDMPDLSALFKEA